MIRVFAGAETYRSRAAFREAQERAAREAGAPVAVLRDEALTPAAFQATVEGQPLFGALPPVAVERLCVHTGERAEAVALVLRHMPSDRVLLVWEEGVPNPQGIVWRALTAVADAVEEFAPLSEPEALAWLAEAVRARGRTIAPDAARGLLAAVGTSLQFLAAEVEKLSLVVAEGSVITAADVDALTPARTTADAFATVRALVRGDAATALRLLAAHRLSGTEPRSLFFLAIQELGRLLRVREAIDAGELVTAWGLAREFRLPRGAADALLATAHKSKTASVRALFDRGVVAYYHLNTGRADAAAVLELLALTSIQVA